MYTLVDQQFGYVRLAAPMLDLAGISTAFRGAISTQFCFTYSLGGVTAIPRGLHARLCHAVLVYFYHYCIQWTEFERIRQDIWRLCSSRVYHRHVTGR